jgi:hypothetical protein
LCLPIAFALSRISVLLYLLAATILCYVLCCINHVASVYRHTKSLAAVMAALLTVIWLPFWAFGILYGLTTPMKVRK